MQYNGSMRDEARPLGSGRPTSSKQPLCLPRRGSSRPSTLASLKDDDRPRFSAEEMERARKSHAENLQRAKEASQREQARLDASRDQADREAQEHRRRIAEQQESQLGSLHDVKPPPERLQEQRKRPASAQSTHTAAVSRSSKVKRQSMNTDILVWQQNSYKDSLIDRALAEGELVPRQATPWLVASCIQDGLTILNKDGDFCIDGLSSDASMRAPYWKKLIEKITVKDDGSRATIDNDGGTGCKRVGFGTFNAVVKFPDGVLPEWISNKCVCRFTRSDNEVGQELKYQNARTNHGEVDNALFCSMNGIGPEVYCVSVFSAPRPCRTLRFCGAMCIQRARKDLHKSLVSMTTFSEGATAAQACIDLLFKASRLGVAFFDIKPGNMLQVSEYPERPCYKLTDYDPAFFLRLEGRDWRTLLLLNMTLLSVHVLNSDHGCVGRGWARTVAPMLRQLIQRKDEYDSEWLFFARFVKVKFDVPLDKSDFQLQRLLCSMVDSYFCSERARDTPSYEWPWKNHNENQSELDNHWEAEANKSSWPPSWTTPDSEPLIKQLVDLALKYA